MHPLCGHSLQQPWEMNTLGSLPYGGKRLSLPRVEGFPRFGIAGPKPGQSQVGGEVSQCSVLGDASWHEELVGKDQAACEVTISLPLGPFKQGGWREGCGGASIR